MWIERTTRVGTCRYCGVAVIWATRVRNGKPVAIDAPIVCAPSLLTDEAPDLVDVDMKRTKLHVQTCTAFEPRLLKGSARHV